MTKTTGSAIVVQNLQKSYGDTKVLRGVNFTVKNGDIMALLGPNGAGKTTTIRILSTLLKSDAGKAQINGYDVETEAAGVRKSIGLTGQYAAVDEYLTGKENLQLMGRLYRLSVEDSNARAHELLQQFDLEESANRAVKTYSGGMKRRIDLAMSLIASPPVIFLDEPTTGLDPRSRQTMWNMIKQLAKNGTTILLTTQYMEEADQLADSIIVIDGGKVIAEGTPDKLKAKVGSERLEFTIGRRGNLEKAAEIIDGEGLQIDKERRSLSFASKGGVGKLRQLLQQLEDAKVEVESISLHRPTLDDVFLTLTGRTTEVEETDDLKRGKK